MIHILLWDVDGTLLDFKAAESAAMKSLFAEFELGDCSDEMIRRYSLINEEHWQRLERNELTKPQVLIGRFEQFFSEIGVPRELAPEFNRRYQLRLGDTIVYRDDSINVIKRLRGRVRQYVVSNGTVAAQTKKLCLSGLGELMDGVFLSEELGAEKPNRAFFEAVFAAVGPVRRDEVMIVGDSLTSDILGGNNAGIPTCWYDPEGRPVPEGYHVDHTVTDLHQVISLVEASGVPFDEESAVKAWLERLNGLDVEAKKMFGCCCLYCDGQAVGWLNDGMLSLREVGLSYLPADIKRPGPEDRIRELVIPFCRMDADWLPRAVKDTADIRKKQAEHTARKGKK